MAVTVYYSQLHPEIPTSGDYHSFAKQLKMSMVPALITYFIDRCLYCLVAKPSTVSTTRLNWTGIQIRRAVGRLLYFGLAGASVYGIVVIALQCDETFEDLWFKTTMIQLAVDTFFWGILAGIA